MSVQDQTQQEPRLGIDVIGFGVGEFAYLLNVFEGPARDRSVSVFRAQDMVDDRHPVHGRRIVPDGAGPGHHR